MRQLLIKLFVLNYYTKIFKIRVIFARPVAVIVPFMALGMYSSNNEYNTLSLIIVLAVVLLFYIPKFYFKKKPPRWYELDLIQKWFYLKKYKPKNIDYKQIEEINKKVNSYSKKTFHNTVPLLIALFPIGLIIYAIFQLLK